MRASTLIRDDGNTLNGKAACVAAKHGTIGLTKVTALDAAGTGVTCNAICPGWVLTPLGQQQVDDRAAHTVTGSQIQIDAGWTAQ